MSRPDDLPVEIHTGLCFVNQLALVEVDGQTVVALGTAGPIESPALVGAAVHDARLYAQEILRLCSAAECAACAVRPDFCPQHQPADKEPAADDPLLCLCPDETPTPPPLSSRLN